MLGNPKFKRNDAVRFEINGEIKTGWVYIVDRYGTFFQTKEPSYDIMVEDADGPCLYKHIPESEVL